MPPALHGTAAKRLIDFSFPAPPRASARAVAHLLANGTLADVLLFGGFLVWAVADRWSFTRRPPQVMMAAPPSRRNDWIAIALGLVVYVPNGNASPACLTVMPHPRSSLTRRRE